MDGGRRVTETIDQRLFQSVVDYIMTKDTILNERPKSYSSIDNRMTTEDHHFKFPHIVHHDEPQIEYTGEQQQQGPKQRQQQPSKVHYKYQEDTILHEIMQYIDKTYQGHYVGEDNVQSLDLILSTGHADGFVIGSLLKYASRYGKKNGFNRDDLLKIIHYAILGLYWHTKKHQNGD